MVAETREVCLHCSRAPRRSGLWNPDNRLPTGAFPTRGRIVCDQVKLPVPAKLIDLALRRDAKEPLLRTTKMAFMERVIAPATDDELAVVRLLRHYCATRGRAGDGTGLPRLVALGQSLRLPPAGSVALASVFQLTEAVLGRRLMTECCCSRCLNGDERAVIRLLGSRMPTVPGTAMPDIPHGLPGALAWAVLSVRRLCGDIVPARPRMAAPDENGCPFARAIVA